MYLNAFYPKTKELKGTKAMDLQNGDSKKEAATHSTGHISLVFFQKKMLRKTKNTMTATIFPVALTAEVQLMGSKKAMSTISNIVND